MTSAKKIIAGAALGTLLGSLIVALYPKRNEIFDVIREQSTDYADKAKQYADLILNGKQAIARNTNNSFLKGGILGALLGAGAALLLAPKTGRQLRNQVSQAYNEISDKTEHVVDLFKNNSHNPFGARSTIKKKRRIAKKL
jgi:hypothetical protein